MAERDSMGSSIKTTKQKSSEIISTVANANRAKNYS